MSVASLVRTAGPPWEQLRSPRFVLYAERGDRPRYDAAALLDSLEVAWAHGARLLGVAPRELPAITVFVTRTPARFPQLIAPTGRGVMMAPTPAAAEIIVLIHNDSSRVFARHEVMHALALRALGRASAWWLSEGLATWADGRCGPTSIEAVAREQLRENPGLTARRLARYFEQRDMRSLGDRHAAYALAGSLVAAVYAEGGMDGVRALWGAAPDSGASPLRPDTLTARWRAYVERASAGQPSLPADRLEHFGCG